MKKDKLPYYLLNNYFVYHFVSNFSALLLHKINILYFFDMGDFIQVFVMSRNIEILIDSND